MATLDFYDRNAEEYGGMTFSADMSETRQVFLNLLKEGDSVLDLGCGSGRDSKAFLEAGLAVTAVDGSAGMCEVARRNTGLPVRRMLFSELDYDSEFDGVWACASLLHVPAAELPGVLSLVRRALKDWGVFFCCFKKGWGERTDGERVYTDMLLNTLSDLLGESGFLPIRVWETPGPNGATWVNAVSRKTLD
ncbi:MAG: class I SAM-dependent methyltransferase [Candidatus Methanomethylophilus sp.]|nr:class I SAM-dependent methyltransferase [Methanomethylophilus sp.]